MQSEVVELFSLWGENRYITVLFDSDFDTDSYKNFISYQKLKEEIKGIENRLYIALEQYFFTKHNYSWSKEIFLVELADKLQNLLSDYNVWKEKGSKGLQTLSTTYEMNKWYYTSMQKKFHENIPEEPLLKRYDELITLYFGD